MTWIKTLGAVVGLLIAINTLLVLIFDESSPLGRFSRDIFLVVSGDLRFQDISRDDTELVNELYGKFNYMAAFSGSRIEYDVKRAQLDLYNAFNKPTYILHKDKVAILASSVEEVKEVITSISDAPLSNPSALPPNEDGEQEILYVQYFDRGTHTFWNNICDVWLLTDDVWLDCRE